MPRAEVELSPISPAAQARTAAEEPSPTEEGPSPSPLGLAVAADPAAGSAGDAPGLTGPYFGATPLADTVTAFQRSTRYLQESLCTQNSQFGNIKEFIVHLLHTATQTTSITVDDLRAFGSRIYGMALAERDMDIVISLPDTKNAKFSGFDMLAALHRHLKDVK